MNNKQRNAFTRNIHNKLKAAGNLLKGELLINDIARNACLWMQKKGNPLFTSVEIETTSICNRKCDYCPNSTSKRSGGYLPDEIFYKAIDQLAELNYSGRLSTHLYGEPLLDKRIVKFIDYARQKLPNAFIKFFTNGDLLTYQLLNDLDEAGVDVFRISQHDKDPVEGLLSMLEQYKTEKGSDKIEYMKYFDNDDDLMNRGGLVEVEHDVKMNFCEFISGITIDFEGNMVLCCQDYHGKVKFGNLKDEKLIDIWNKDRYKLLRDRLSCGFWPIDLCRVCNGLEPLNSKDQE